MFQKIFLWVLFLGSCTLGFSQPKKWKLFVETGGNYSSHRLIEATYRRIPDNTYPADSKDLPTFKGGISYNFALNAEYGLSEKIKMVTGLELITEKTIIQSGTLRKTAGNSPPFFYQSTTQSMQQALDLTWGLAYEFSLNRSQKLVPGINLGTSHSINEGNAVNSFIAPSLQWFPSENWYMGFAVKLNGRISEKDIAGLTGDNIFLEGLQAKTILWQFNIGCRIF